ncbi:MAG: dihydroorotate dehydrogenase [Candidatus Marinimicrobia bacterium]|nr:dihydroorotate dehydrogenase [Candidatus Neomarinimicrobiota bacterium]MCH8068536.1 dihydroorotate dehydrogenase [Candidatus Neomarinimicrobiota bacterium]
MVDLSIKIKNVEFSNPVLVASGTFGYGNEVNELVDVNRLGGIVTKSITLHPREGNPPPRMVETPSGLLNSIGLANIGVERYISEMLPYYEELDTNVIMNIAGSSLQEYITILERVEGTSNYLSGYEINISCPNVEKGGLEFGVDCDLTLALTKELRKRTDKLLIMKLSPNVTDIASIAKAAELGGVDAISAINTVVGMSINPQTRKQNIFTGLSGLSGPAIRPVGVANVYKIFDAVDIPIIGIGGITSADDVVEYLLAGATAVQVGTANFRDPGIGIQIIKQLFEYCEEHNVPSIRELVGAIRDED